jgi:uncharacterized protein (TIGR02118 family)
MRRLMFAAAALSAAACVPAKSGMTNADSAMNATMEQAAARAATTMPVAMGPQAIVTVLYNQPKDAAAFEAYYPKHRKLVGDNQAAIGFTKVELTKFVSALDGSAAPLYRQAELYFPSLEAAKKGIATPEFKRVADDLANFATGGLTALIALETGDAGTAACPALVTVIYETPTSAADFEAYYPGHLKLVGEKQSEIGFVRADLTKFASALDGSAAPKYRQAELCFPSMEALKAGLATPGFKAVGDDLPRFATGGLVALIGEQQ